MYNLFELTYFRRNILGFEDDTELRKCRYDPADPTNRFCPIFALHEIISRAHENYTDLAASVIFSLNLLYKHLAKNLIEQFELHPFTLFQGEKNNGILLSPLTWLDIYNDTFKPPGGSGSSQILAMAYKDIKDTIFKYTLTNLHTFTSA